MKNLFYVALIGLSTIVGGVINYLYHPLMIRYLSIGEFAEFESLVGIFNILWVITTGIGLFLVKEIAKNSKNPETVKSIFRFSNRFLLVVGCLSYALFALLSPLIARFLKLDSAIPVLMTGTIIVFSFQGTVVWAVLQGLKMFRFIAAGGVLWAVFRLAFGLLFVFFGYGLYGAVGGFVISGAVLFLVNFVYVWFRLREYRPVEDAAHTLREDFKKDFWHIFHFFLLAFFLSVLMNMDVVFAKNLYDADTAGAYAGVSVIAKFLIFLWGAVETVYYPQIMEHEKKRTPKHFLVNSFFMLLLLGFSALAFNAFFGGMLLDIMKPWLGTYRDTFLGILAFCGLFTFVSLYAKVLVGWKIYAINTVLWTLLAGLFGLLAFLRPADIRTFVFLFVGVGFLAAMACGALVIRTLRTHRTGALYEKEAIRE